MIATGVGILMHLTVDILMHLTTDFWKTNQSRRMSREVAVLAKSAMENAVTAYRTERAGQLAAKQCAELARCVTIPHAAIIEAASRIETGAEESVDAAKKTTKKKIVASGKLTKKASSSKRVARQSRKWGQYADKDGEYDNEDEEEEKKEKAQREHKKKEQDEWTGAQEEGKTENHKSNSTQSTKVKEKGKDVGKGGDQQKLVVEHILDQRTLTKGHYQGKVQFLVKWRGVRLTKPGSELLADLARNDNAILYF